MHDKERLTLMKQLVRCKQLSDGAKVTLLEFLTHFWEGDKKLPSYSDLCEIRSVQKSTIQLHITELEKFGVLKSFRLPNNRKRYTLDGTVLGVANKKATSIKKPVGKYHTFELVGYFQYLYKEVTGECLKTDKQDYIKMKGLQREYGAATIVSRLVVFKELYRKRHWGSFTVSNFADRFSTIQ